MRPDLLALPATAKQTTNLVLEDVTDGERRGPLHRTDGAKLIYPKDAWP